jgi:hypothetical protein
VIDAFANRIVALSDLHANPFRVTAWKASRSAKTDFVLDALEQALYARRPPHQGGLIWTCPGFVPVF